MISTPWMRDHPFYDALSKPELQFKPYTWPSAMNPMVSKERLELERRTIGDFAFNREYNAAFMDDQFSHLPQRPRAKLHGRIRGERGPTAR